MSRPIFHAVPRIDALKSSAAATIFCCYVRFHIHELGNLIVGKRGKGKVRFIASTAIPFIVSGAD
jgi:hypothetical protein